MDLESLTDAVNECDIRSDLEESEYEDSEEIVLDLDNKKVSKIRKKWPKVKLSKTPAIFLHKPVKFDDHVQKILGLGIHFYQPTLGQNFTKISCESLLDHKLIIKYFENRQLPYHTFGIPAKRKIKAVIRGLPKDTSLDKMKTELKASGVPVIRVHKMKTKDDDDNPNMLVLAVVPNDRQGLAIRKLKKLLGYNVTVEPPNRKINQCFRCQKWGHTERYCHGAVKCVKCAGDHLYKKCTRNHDSEEPPKCANCGGAHTANYKKCPQSPFSVGYELSQITKQIMAASKTLNKPKLVTKDNCFDLYKKKYYDSE